MNFYTTAISFINNFTKGHVRSIKLKKNIVRLFLLKGGSIAINLLLVPLTIYYVNPTQYGIWITLSSIIGWFAFFDIGFGNGLRNKFAESISRGEHENAQIYVSTTYAILSIIMAVALLLFFLINPFLNWTKILNTPPSMASELRLLALTVFVFFSLQFVLQLLSTVMTANQEPAKASLINLIGNVFSLVLIFVLTKTTSGNLVYLSICLSAAPVIVLLAANLWFYRKEYKFYVPSFKHVSFKHARNLMGLGVKFFIIQIAALILFQTDNIIITQLFGPAEVTVFNLAFKVFSLGIMIFTVIATPLWSAFTDAYAKSDFVWIRNILKTMKKIWLVIIVFTIVLLFSSNKIFVWWVGSRIKVPFSLSLGFSFYIIVCTWQTIHIYFLNGIGKIRLQLCLVLICGLINIPMAIFLGKKIGLLGITLSNTLLFALMGIVFSIQTNKIINNKASGIWNK